MFYIPHSVLIATDYNSPFSSTALKMLFKEQISNGRGRRGDLVCGEEEIFPNITQPGYVQVCVANAYKAVTEYAIKKQTRPFFTDIWGKNRRELKSRRDCWRRYSRSA